MEPVARPPASPAGPFTKKGKTMPKLGLLLMIAAAANVVTALAAVFIAVQVGRMDISNVAISIEQPVDVRITNR
jgi:hypothetical protein